MKTILFLHGGIIDVDRALYLPMLTRLITLHPTAFKSIRIEYPMAPGRVMTVYPGGLSGVKARSWADLEEELKDFTPASLSALKIDRLGIYRSTQYIARLVAYQKCRFNINPSDVMIMGHSMGAIMALEMALSTDIPFAGVLSISGVVLRAKDFLFPKLGLPYSATARAYKLSVLHGTSDKILPYVAAVLTQSITKPIMEGTGGSFELIPLTGLDHLKTLFASPDYYNAIYKAIQQTFGLSR